MLKNNTIKHILTFLSLLHRSVQAHHAPYHTVINIISEHRKHKFLDNKKLVGRFFNGRAGTLTIFLLLGLSEN